MSSPPAFPPPRKVKRIYLIRHAETEANASGVLQGRGINLPLSERGRRQSAELAEKFKDTQVDLVVVSSLVRTRETASYIHKYHPSVEIVERGNIDEISWGTWEGKLHKELPLLSGLLDSWHNGKLALSAPEGDSAFDMERRAVPEIYDALKRPVDHIVIVAHGRLLRAILASLIHRDLTKMAQYKHHNTSVNVLDVVTPQNVDLTCLQNESVTAQSVTCLAHPPNVDFIPVLLDDRTHLSPGMVEEMKKSYW